jgi:hypothetical protein
MYSVNLDYKFQNYLVILLLGTVDTVKIRINVKIIILKENFNGK